jgi:Protein of unknown function (DUF4238)
MALDNALTASHGRLDHLLPRSYLEGFTNPSEPGQLCVYDVHGERWFESGVAGVAGQIGYYDYSLGPGSQRDQTADQAFRKLEDRFPNVRRELIANRFSGWRSHLEFLLSYAQMLRARSERFRGDTSRQLDKRLTRATEVFRDEGAEQARIVFEHFIESATRDTLLKNASITIMRGEIAKGPALFSHMYWCLRLVENVSDPFITSDDAIIVEMHVDLVERSRTTGFYFSSRYVGRLV